MTRARTRSGTIVVAVVLLLGLGIGSLGAWWVVKARPRPGEIIDALAIPGGAVVVRREASSDRAMVELYDGPKLRWRALVPTYAGKPGVPAIAASARSVTVRSVRGGWPLVFAFDTAGGAKLASFDLLGEVPPAKGGYTLPHIATISSGTGHAAELLMNPDDVGGAIVIGVALDERRLAWKGTVPWYPLDGWFEGDVLVLDSGRGKRAAFAIADGAQLPPPAGPPPGGPPPRHHRHGDVSLTVTPRAVTILDGPTGRVQATID